MLVGRKRVIALRTKAMLFDVILLVLPVGHFVERQIGNFRQRVVERLGRILFLCLKRRHQFFKPGDLGHQSLGSILVLTFLRLANFL